MGTIHTERMAAEIEGEFVVYVNGMRLNRLRAVREWVVAGRKLARMFERLEADPESGLLGYQPAFMGLRTGAAIQYWRSLEHLKRFAHDREDLHVPAWTWYDEEVGDGGGVGLWAELYVVESGNYETFFRNVPPVGLGAAADLVPMSEHRLRLGLADRRGEPPADGRDGGGGADGDGAP